MTALACGRTAPGPRGTEAPRVLARMLRDPLRAYAGLTARYGDAIRLPIAPRRSAYLLSRPEHRLIQPVFSRRQVTACGTTMAAAARSLACRWDRLPDGSPLDVTGQTGGLEQDPSTQQERILAQDPAAYAEQRPAAQRLDMLTGHIPGTDITIGMSRRLLSHAGIWPAQKSR
jgi:hypothetical protein